MPTDVAVIMAPTNNAGTVPSIESKSANPKKTVAANPITNGRMTPPAATAVAGRTYRLN